MTGAERVATNRCSRRWWVVGAATWPGESCHEGRSGRDALAAYRRSIIDAERDRGVSVRDATIIAQAAELAVLDGPLTTEQARDRSYGWALAWAICDTSRERNAPMSPATEADASPWLDADHVARIRRDVDRTFGCDSND